jgi:hypothetical protein
MSKYELNFMYVLYYNRTTAIFNYENDLMFNLSVYFNQFW